MASRALVTRVWLLGLGDEMLIASSVDTHLGGGRH